MRDGPGAALGRGDRRADRGGRQRHADRSHTSIPLRPGDRLAIAAPRVRGSAATWPSAAASKVAPDAGQPVDRRAVRTRAGAAGGRPGARIGRSAPPLPDTDLAPPHQPRKTLAVLPGPRRDWFTDAAWSTLLTTGWTVSADSNRVAVRLDGGRARAARTDELPSEGMVRGAVQVPASGQPLIFGRRPPGHRRLSGDRRADRAGRRPRRPAATRRDASGSAPAARGVTKDIDSASCRSGASAEDSRAISKVLVANRGEIAVRVIRAAADAGLPQRRRLRRPGRGRAVRPAGRRGVRPGRVEPGRDLPRHRQDPRRGRAVAAPTRCIPGTASWPRTPTSPRP